MLLSGKRRLFFLISYPDGLTNDQCQFVSRIWLVYSMILNVNSFKKLKREGISEMLQGEHKIFLLEQYSLHKHLFVLNL